MAYRRKQGAPRSSTLEDFRPQAPADDPTSTTSLATRAIRASSALRDSTLPSGYGESAIASVYAVHDRQRTSPPVRDSSAYEYTSMKSLESKPEGFWGVLARKAKSIRDDDNALQQKISRPSQPDIIDIKASHWGQSEMLGTLSSQDRQYQPRESYQKADNPAIQKHFGALTSSLNYIGGTIGNALEEGQTIVEHGTADIIQETKKLNTRRKGGSTNIHNNDANASSLPQMQADQETQLKASRDVANAMTAKAKLLLRELKTVKADLAFARERCAQLEEENKVLRESREKGDHTEDDDLIRLQLETLLAEKARLAHENSIYARENNFLREIVEYHQLTMQDVVYLDEGIEEVTEVYRNQIPIVLS